MTNKQLGRGPPAAYQHRQIGPALREGKIYAIGKAVESGDCASAPKYFQAHEDSANVGCSGGAAHTHVSTISLSGKT